MYYAGEIEPAALSKELKLLLPRYMLPGSVHKLETMPLTDNGKLNRRLLLEMASEND
jgi:acyl-CoA synthetase (AMP-forming)/AMP-acid ligase II